jgi:hypothetical protein
MLIPGGDVAGCGQSDNLPCYDDFLAPFRNFTPHFRRPFATPGQVPPL